MIFRGGSGYINLFSRSRVKQSLVNWEAAKSSKKESLILYVAAESSETKKSVKLNGNPLCFSKGDNFGDSLSACLDDRPFQKGMYY